ncbi:lytic transglycosylase domain-containing protein [Sphingomonas sp. S2-65]|uniref:lytic transglycosylase domain-containing protein n=1 Tax=Sphingomonas sp. S2-65 TaxID=2903960 RepID=UPI001F183C79|nr:lytic transglycosylase domain-containing protein [Sphingomonas sp. S2-65]UYY57022.1 lytic transglycosylase domain-containing protein [Sphingomonas sp. S2-65]
MVTLRMVAAGLCLVAPSAQAQVSRWSAEITAAATRCGVPADWIARVMQAESGGRTRLAGRPIRSPKGAIGLMQLMPGTWAELRRDLGLSDDPDQPADNIVAGACYLRRMHDRFGYPGLFGAYNAGPARYAAWLAGQASLPGETVAYLRNVGDATATSTAAANPRTDTLFLVRREGQQASPSAAGQAPGAALFVLRREVP